MKEKKEAKKEHIHKTELVVGPKEKQKHHIDAPQMPEKKSEMHPAAAHKHISQQSSQHAQHASSYSSSILRRKGLISEYLASWKEVRSLKYLLLILLDVGLYVVLYPLFYLFGLFVGKILQPFQSINVDNLATQTPEQLGIYQQSLSGIVLFLFLLCLAFSLLFILIWSLSRGMMWSKLLDRKITLRYLGKFYLLNLLWSLGWGVIAAFYSVFFYRFAGSSQVVGTIMTIAFILLFLIMTYFMYILYYIFTEGENLIFRSLKEAFVLGVTRFTSLALPLLMVIGSVVLIGLFSYIFKLLPQIVMEILSYMLFFGVFAWIKIYCSNALKERI
ncbi:hypothetical protein COV19_02965 [Candidatus Woesearchaeota archaeon CG10_big_fil_rev_8_21_14_0_10_44_13]|nr:MAG: hypothetical protein COV19_02965 [Candidatus Woesearchaeota archaeon CG10_big_fil_rev_8_21_14_0_10_44_13]